MYKLPRFCELHRRDGMIEVVVTYCGRKGCAAEGPVYNYKAESRGRYCEEHKLEH
ncbi:unnamed protein product, partial [Heterosigma akashiwo]